MMKSFLFSFCIWFFITSKIYTNNSGRTCDTEVDWLFKGWSVHLYYVFHPHPHWSISVRLRKACGFFYVYDHAFAELPKAQAWPTLQDYPHHDAGNCSVLSMVPGVWFLLCGQGGAFVDVIGAWAQQKYAAAAEKLWQFFRCPRPGKDERGNCGWPGNGWHAGEK